MECPGLRNLEEFEPHLLEFALGNVRVFVLSLFVIQFVVVKVLLPFGGVEVRLFAPNV